MKLLLLTPDNVTEISDRVASVMREGGLCCFPTDTVYGIGGLAFSRKVLQKLLTVKPDRSAKPTAVLIDSIIRMSQCAADVPGPKIIALAERFWPGPLTMVWKASPVIDAEFHAADGSLGYRVPDSAFLLAILERIDAPLWATSANLPGHNAPGLFAEIGQPILDACDLIVQTRELLRGRASTVVDVRGRDLIVLRNGALKEQELVQTWKKA